MWASSSMRAAIESLVEIGREETARDLKRILDSLDIDDSNPLRLPLAEEIAENIIEATTLADLTEALSQMAQVLDFDYATFFLINDFSTGFAPTKAITTYPGAWVQAYVGEKLSTCDPVIEKCISDRSSFFWDELQTDAPIVAKFMERAESLGIGPSGYTSLVTMPTGEEFALSVSSSMDPLDFRVNFSRKRADCQELTRYMAVAFSEILSDAHADRKMLTDDCFRVLRALANGTTREELASQSYTYGSFSTIVESIKLALRAKTLEQAAMIAVRARIIDAAPIESGDIFRHHEGYEDEGDQIIDVRQHLLIARKSYVRSV